MGTALWVVLFIAPAWAGGPYWGGGGWYGGYGGFGFPSYSSSGFVHFGGPANGTYGGYAAPEYGSNYQVYRPFNSIPDFDQYQWKQDRDQHEQRLEAKRQLEDERRDARAAARGQYAYTPPPAQPYSISLTGYEPMNYDQVVEASLERNQAKVRQAVAPKPLPAIDGYVLVGVRDSYFYYKDGEFFARKVGELRRVAAPVGAVVMDIPDGAEPKIVNRRVYYTWKDAWYIQTEFLEETVYKVVAPPEAQEAPSDAPTSPEG